MKSRKRTFQKGILNHCYQRTVDKSVLFYNVSDYLVYFTLYCTTARKYDVQVLSLCQMPDHLHQSVRAKRLDVLSAFVGEVTRTFSKVHNETCHRKGALFESPYGSAPKNGDKKARTNLIYVGNNPVERRICSQAEDYRWNYLAYAASAHPFSEPLIVRQASSALQKALREVKRMRTDGKPLAYAQLQRLFQPLDRKEKQQLTDYIIGLYNVIDYDEAIRFFGSYEDMLLAMHSNTGSEYDLNESFIGKDDTYYYQMSRIVSEKLPVTDVHDVLALSPEEKFEVFQLLRRETFALGEQIAAFLRMPVKTERF